MLMTRHLTTATVRILSAGLILSLLPLDAFALMPNELLLVVNKNVPESQQLAEFYARTRRVPDNHIVTLDLPTTEQMTFDTYERSVSPPLRQFLRQNDPDNQIKCLVTFYGVPFRVLARTDDAEETAELKILRDQLKIVSDRIAQTTVRAESMAGALDAAFKPLVPGAPLADPESGITFDHFGRRLDVAGKSIVQSIGKISDPGQVEFQKSQLLTLIRDLSQSIADLPEVGAAAGAGTPSTDASQPSDTSARSMQLLDDHRFDPTVRRTIRRSTLASSGLLNYAKLLIAQIGYLSVADSESATDSELSLLRFGFYPRQRWQLNTLHYRLGNGTTSALMVCRLDAPTPDIVHSIIVDSLRAETRGLDGKIVIDSRGLQMTGVAKDDGYATYDVALRNLASIIRSKSKLAMVFDEKPEVLPAHSQQDVALYCGWYSAANYVPACAFVSGAVGYHMASFEMGSLRDPGNNGWVRGLLKDGVAATLGPEAEPYLQSFPKPDEFFPLLLTGKLTLAEVYWKTEIMCSWRESLIGDPLYRPYAINPALNARDLSPELQRALAGSVSRPSTIPAAH